MHSKSFDSQNEIDAIRNRIQLREEKKTNNIWFKIII